MKKTIILLISIFLSNNGFPVIVKNVGRLNLPNYENSTIIDLESRAKTKSDEKYQTFEK